MRKVLVIHGPNLDLLGQREVHVYGKVTLKEINAALKKESKKSKVQLTIVQSNHEGKIVDLIGKAGRNRFQGILVNPAAYTHTSVAIRDALSASALPAVEVHLSNIYRREEFRQRSVTVPACVGQVSGFGIDSYLLGFQALLNTIERENLPSQGA